MRIAFNTLFSTEATLTSINTFFDQLDVDYELSQTSQEGVSIQPLHLIPVLTDENQRMFTLFSVNERRNFLLIRNDAVDKDDRIGLGKNALVKITPQFVTRKLASIRSDVEFKMDEAGSILNGLKDLSIENAVIEGCFISNEIIANYKAVKLDSREFGHSPGQGFFAVVGPKDLSLGKMLRRANTQDIITICNIERKMSQLTGNLLNNHCEIDDNANIHLWAYDENAEVHLSQSTRNEIEERALKELVG